MSKNTKRCSKILKPVLIAIEDEKNDAVFILMWYHIILRAVLNNAAQLLCVNVHVSEHFPPCVHRQVNQRGAAVARCSPLRRLCGSCNSCDGVSQPEDPSSNTPSLTAHPWGQRPRPRAELRACSAASLLSLFHMFLHCEQSDKYLYYHNSFCAVCLV